MTHKPSEAELAQLELLEKAATPGPWHDGNGYRVHAPVALGEHCPGICKPDCANPGCGEVIADLKHADGGSPQDVRLIAAARNALPGLLLRIRELEAAYGEALGVAERGLERAEAAEKRAAELEAERLTGEARLWDLRAMPATTAEARRPLPPGDLANALQDRIHPASGRLLSASPVVAKPDAGLREALEAAVDFIATGDFTDDARRKAIAKAESVLAGAEAGELPSTPADRLEEWQSRWDLACEMRKREIFDDETFERVKARLVCELREMPGPKETGERRVFEGIPIVGGLTMFLHRPGLGQLRTNDNDWLRGLEGKRVRLSVEVLPDPKEAP